MTKLDVNDERVLETIHELITSCGGRPEDFNGELVAQMIQNSLKLLSEGHDTGQLKLINRSLKEMRYAYRVFNQHKGKRLVSIFGSARTPEDHPDYHAARNFSIAMADKEWMCMTGAANGIMKAGLEGHSEEGSFGLSIRLPQEITTNPVIEGDPRHIMFRYFFTRKLMFLSHSDAVAAFPGGFGTMDELFEVLTLLQTGKASIVPIVLLEGKDRDYWENWKSYVKEDLLANGWIGSDDQYFFYHAPSTEDAVNHILQFYRRYHSSRYVKDDLILRLQSPLTEQQVQLLNDKFNKLVKSGAMRLSKALPEEDQYLELPRLVFHHTRKDFGLVRALIDQINTM